MFISGTFTKAVMYIMLLCDSIIVGYFVGQSGVAAINAITPVTGIVTFFGDLALDNIQTLSMAILSPDIQQKREKIYQAMTERRRESVSMQTSSILLKKVSLSDPVCMRSGTERTLMLRRLSTLGASSM